MKLWEKSIIVQLVSSFLVLSLITLLVVGCTAFFQAKQALKQSAIERLSAAAALKSDELNTWTQNRRRDVLSLAQLPEVKQKAKELLTGNNSPAALKSTREELLYALNSYARNNAASLKEVFIASPSGRIILSTNKNREGIYQPLVQYTEVAPGKTHFVSNLYASPDQGKPTITFAVFLSDQDNRKIGILAANLNLERIDEVIHLRDGLGETGKTYLVGNVGSDLYHHHALISASRFGSQEFPDEIDSFAIQQAIQGNSGEGLYKNYQGVPVIGVYRWLEQQDFALFAEIDQQEVFVPATSLAKSTLVVGVASAIILALGMLFLARRLTHPILEIASTARLVGNMAQCKNFNLLQPIPVIVDNEIGVLARTFNQMIQQLQYSYWQLEEHRHNLEGMVEQRTQELTIQNERLENTLQKLRQTQAQLVQTEKMASLGQLVAGVAHEINNPVNFIQANLEYLEQYTQDLMGLVQLYQKEYPAPKSKVATHLKDIDWDFLQQDLPKVLTSMRVGAERIIDIVSSLRTFSRLDEAQMKKVDLHPGIDSTLLILQNRLRGKSSRLPIQVRKEYGELPRIYCYPGQLNQALMNILSNAIDALEEGMGRWGEREMGSNLPIKPTTQTLSRTRVATPPQISICTELRDQNWIVIRISDNGGGIPQEIQDKLFDPFFTTKPVGKGTGLGLSISYSIVVERHKGKLFCQSQEGQGTEFVIEIPALTADRDREISN